MHTPCPSYRTPWDDWYEDDSDLDQEPILAICYWIAAPNGNPHEDPEPNRNHFEITVIRNPDPEDSNRFTTDFPHNESLLLIY